MSELLTEAPALPQVPSVAFPTFSETDLEIIRSVASSCSYADGESIFRAGDANIDLLIVESGGIDIHNPFDHDRHVVTHRAGQFAGDIDLLTRRPVIINATANGPTTLLRVPVDRMREVLSKVPSLGDKMLIAVMERRRILTESGQIGLKVVGPGVCKHTMQVREFLYKNFVPFTWYDSLGDTGKDMLAGWGTPNKSPVIERSDHERIISPDLRELAEWIGVWQHCPTQSTDLAIIGAGPAGLAAAVYAASEGVATVVIDRLGPGGQAAGSSKIENFMGFPSGLTGAELAMRGTVQMLKFGAKIVAPVSVESIEPAKTPADCHVLHLDCGAKMHAKAVLISTGVTWRKLEAPGAEKFESAGVHYACTSVEAMLYDTRDVAVIGGGNSAGQAAMYLAECCRNRTVHLVIRKKLARGMSDYLVGRIRSMPNMKVHEGSQITKVIGNRRIESVTLQTQTMDATDHYTGEKQMRDLPLSAVFVFIGAEPGCSWLPAGIARDSLGYILTGVDALKSGLWPLADREPCPLETTIPGILAAGDIRSGSTKRVGFAVGDGSLAVTCVHRLTAIRN